MMTSQSIQRMKVSQTLVLTKSQLFWHYFIVFFFLIPPILTTIEVFKYYVTNTYTGVRSIQELTTWGYWPVLLALTFYFVQKRRLKFKVLEFKVDHDTFVQIVKEVAQKLEWKITEKRSNLIVAKSGFSWKSWGELITIIWDQDQILMNSICDPDGLRPSVASWGMNKLNLKTFEQSLKQSA